jgi:hypothetical protein
MGVHVGELQVGPAVVLDDAGVCEVALAHRREIRRTELCGYDVFFEPIVETGVVVLRRRGDGWTRVAAGRFDDVSGALETLLTSRDTDGDGRVELVLHERLVLVVQRRRVVVQRTLTP